LAELNIALEEKNEIDKASFCISCLSELSFEEICLRLSFSSLESLLNFCRLLGKDEAIERIDKMDLKVAQLSDIVKYAVLELEETPSELLLHGEPIDQVQAASSPEDVKKLLLRFYRFLDESDSIDIVMLHFDLGDRQPSAVLS
jgi:hypothetical protein